MPTNPVLRQAVGRSAQVGSGELGALQGAMGQRNLILAPQHTRKEKKKRQRKKAFSVDGSTLETKKVFVWVVRSGGRTGRPFKSAYL